MHVITTRLADGVYDNIVREAARRRVSIHEVVDDWLVEGENSGPLPSPEENEAFFAREEHHIAERRALRGWHEALARKLRG